MIRNIIRLKRTTTRTASLRSSATWIGAVNFLDMVMWFKLEMRKALGETQTLRAGCSKAEPKMFAPAAYPLPGSAGGPKLNQLKRVATFTYRHSLVKIDARDFELS